MESHTNRVAAVSEVVGELDSVTGGRSRASAAQLAGDFFSGQWRVPGVFRWMDRGESVNILLVQWECYC